MSICLSVAASLPAAVRQTIGIQVLSRSQPIRNLAAKLQVSRKFVYQQGDKAQQALDDSFAPSQGDDDVLFHLPVTKNWLYQLILVLICHSSYRNVVELFGDLFDTSISIGTIHNRLQSAAATAALIYDEEKTAVVLNLQQVAPSDRLHSQVPCQMHLALDDRCGKQVLSRWEISSVSRIVHPGRSRSAHDPSHETK